MTQNQVKLYFLCVYAMSRARAPKPAWPEAEWRSPGPTNGPERVAFESVYMYVTGSGILL